MTDVSINDLDQKECNGMTVMSRRSSIHTCPEFHPLLSDHSNSKTNTSQGVNIDGDMKH